MKNKWLTVIIATSVLANTGQLYTGVQTTIQLPATAKAAYSTTNWDYNIDSTAKTPFSDSASTER